MVGEEGKFAVDIVGLDLVTEIAGEVEAGAREAEVSDGFEMRGFVCAEVAGKHAYDAKSHMIYPIKSEASTAANAEGKEEVHVSHHTQIWVLGESTNF